MSRDTTIRDDDPVSSVTLPATLVSAGEPESASRIPIGERRYVRVRLIGEGGMAKVHECNDALIGRDVAMKTLHPALQAKVDFRGRFLREASVQGQLEHPSIVPVHDIGFGEGGTVFFVMKRVRGLTLAQILERQNAGDRAAIEDFSRRRLLNAFHTVCLAVDFAHARGVLHRDIKPSNVMLGKFGEVYLLDWGVAKVAGEEEEAPLPDSDSAPLRGTPFESPATAHGALVGTLAYMAPEQANGEPATVATDVFALGAVLFEILSGVPLHGADPRFVAIAKGSFDARCSVRAPERLVPPELEAICVRATAADPGRRHASARELALEVERYLEGDRDVARRRELAAEHLARAQEAIEVAGRDGAGDASLTLMRELGAALTLDPDNAEARALLLRALTTPPRTLPREVERELDRKRDGFVRHGARQWPIMGASWLVFAPLFYWAGVRDAAAVAMAIGLMSVAVIAAVVTARSPARPSGRAELVSVVATALAMIPIARFFGPFVLVPSLLGSFATALQLHPRARVRNVALGTSIVSFLAAVLIDQLGVLPSKTDLTVPALVALTLAQLTSTVNAAFVVAASRSELSRAEERLHLQEWLVRSMTPAATVGRPQATITPS